MKSDAETKAGCLLAGLVFVLGLLATSLFPLSRLVMFPYDLLVAKDPHQRWHLLLSPSQALGLDLLQWGAATVAFAALARNERPVVLAPLTLGAFTLVVIATHAGLRTLGLDFHWELWH